MAAPGGIQEKVARLINKQGKKPVLKPNRPLVLNDSVANSKLQKGEATCVTEMSLLMSCWKKNGFVDALCLTEVDKFFGCVHNALAAAKNRDQAVEGERLPPKLANSLLKRFPNPRSEI